MANTKIHFGNVPFSYNINTRYKQGKSATFTATFEGHTYTRLSGNVKVQAAVSSLSGYNFIKVEESDGFTVCGFINSLEYINNMTTLVKFTIDGWESFKGSVVLKTSYIERYSMSEHESIAAMVLPEPYSSDRMTCYAETQYSISNYKYVIATLHATSVGLYDKVMELYGREEGKMVGKIDNLTSICGTSLNGIYHGCCFVVKDSADEARKCVQALVSSGYENSVLNVFAVPAALITANGTRSQEFTFEVYENANNPLTWSRYSSACTVLADTNIMNLLGTTSAPARTASSMCKYDKIKNMPYTFLRVTTPLGNVVDFDYNDFTDDIPQFAIYGGIGFNSEILLVPLNYQGVEYNFTKSIAVHCNQTGMFSSDTFGSWASSQQLKYISSAISSLSTGINAALAANVGGTAMSGINLALTGLNYNQERSIHGKSSIHTTGNSSSDFAFCHPYSSCFRFMCMSLKPHDAANLEALIDNFGYTVSEYDVPDTNNVEGDCYIKTNNVQLDVNCPDDYAAEIRNLFNAGCKFI